MLYIKNANVVLENGILWNGNIIIENEIIKAVGKKLEKPQGAEEIDAEGLYVGPGFVDIHVHGGNGYDFYENPDVVAGHFLKNGSTTVIPTLFYSMSKQELLDAIESLKKASQKENSTIKGIYMEGPYMNPTYGASPERNKWAGEIKKEDYIELINAAKGFAKVWSIAPEREGIQEFLEDLRENDEDTVISIGHSSTSFEAYLDVKKYGIKMQTHTTNATGQDPRRRGTRSFGPDEVCLWESDMYAELISDSEAIHVSPQMQQLILKVKGVDKVVLITDSNVGVSNPPEELKDIKDLLFDVNGRMNGSQLTMNMACKNIMSHTRAGITEAFIMASRNPAKVIGMDKEIGSIEKGKKADLVFVDHEFNVKKVILHGKEI